VAVMYAGKIVETGLTRDIMDKPMHPYTAALLDAVPKPGSRGTLLRSIEGQPPDPVNLPPACSFAVRCSRANDRCSKEAPIEIKINDQHSVSCFYAG
jgi:oligopeptide/dipeptide ABC transporter ATP-binding protein